MRWPRRGGLGAGARQVPAAKWFLLQPSGFNRFPILYLSGWNFPGWGPARRGMFDLERMSKSGLKRRGCRQRSEGHRHAVRAAGRTGAGSSSGGTALPQDTALTPQLPQSGSPEADVGRERLWMQLGVRGGGGVRLVRPPRLPGGLPAGLAPIRAGAAAGGAPRRRGWVSAMATLARSKGPLWSSPHRFFKLTSQIPPKIAAV